MEERAQTTLADALDRPDLEPAPPVALPATHAGPDRLFNAPATMRGQLNLEGT